jgi:hypothetical protein
LKIHHLDPSLYSIIKKRWCGRWWQSIIWCFYIFFILVYISFSYFEDQLQGKNLRKQSYLTKKQELKKMHKKGQKGRNTLIVPKIDITGATSIGSRSVTMRWKAKTKSYNFRVEAKIKLWTPSWPRWLSSCHDGRKLSAQEKNKICN